MLTNAPNAKSHIAKERPGHRTQRDGLAPAFCDCCRKPRGMNGAWSSLEVSESTPTLQMRDDCMGHMIFLLLCAIKEIHSFSNVQFLV